ncbi:thioesterase family protein [Brevibacterium litoralis]|uniref:thioesterase family protein n=1 Tax=Brevibacterium litoralis TaxID=3138935 RepID=UPI0032EB3987
MTDAQAGAATPEADDRAFYTVLEESRDEAANTTTTLVETHRCTTGMWDPGHQHAGPPAALLAHCISRHDMPADFRLADVKMDIFGPIPVAPLTVTTEVIRGGRTMDLLQATAAPTDRPDRPAVQVRAWRIRRAPETYPVVTGHREVAAPGDGVGEDGAPRALGRAAGATLRGGETFPGPEDLDAQALNFNPHATKEGYGSAVEWRWVSGGPGTLAPALVWGRCLVPLVQGRETSGWEKLLVLADSAGGISLPVDTRKYRYVNCDMHVALDRDPEGDWILLDAQAIATPGHGGIVHDELSDRRGVLGVGVSTMVTGEL